MRIVSLNTWKNEGDYARRLDLMAAGLKALAPDLVCLQECFVGGGLDTARRLAEHLGLVCFAAPSRAKPRRHGQGLIDSTSGLAVLARRPGPWERRDLPTDPADGDRIALRLDVETDGPPLRVLNLHLTHLSGAGELRGRQLAQALAFGEEGWTGALVVAGDLNAPAQAPELSVLGLTPAPSTLHGARQGQESLGSAIDHVHLWRPGGWRVVATGRGLGSADPQGWYPSDHAAVVLDLVPAQADKLA